MKFILLHPTQEQIDELKANGYLFVLKTEDNKVIFANGPIVVPNNQIWYITSDGQIAKTTYSTGISSLNSMGLVSNTYENDRGIMTFDKDILQAQVNMHSLVVSHLLA